MYLSARLDRDPRGLLVLVAGGLDRATAPVLDAVLHTATRLLTATPGRAPASTRQDRGLLIDLRDLDFADRDGLLPLRAAHSRLLAVGRLLQLTLVPAPVLHLLTQLPDRQLLTATTPRVVQTGVALRRLPAGAPCASGEDSATITAPHPAVGTVGRRPGHPHGLAVPSLEQPQTPVVPVAATGHVHSAPVASEDRLSRPERPS